MSRTNERVNALLNGWVTEMVEMEGCTRLQACKLLLKQAEVAADAIGATVEQVKAWAAVKRSNAARDAAAATTLPWYAGRSTCWYCKRNAPVLNGLCAGCTDPAALPACPSCLGKYAACTDCGKGLP